MKNEESHAKRQYTLTTLQRYWPRGREHVAGLPIFEACLSHSDEPLPPHMVQVHLPEWAADLGIDGALLVPAQFVTAGDTPQWLRTDWLGVAHWYLDGVAERAFEQRNGPIHSYSYRLRGWDGRMWKRAWVNRTALWLRRWAAREQNASEEALFGPLTDAEILLTHDVDAVEKTFAIRCKRAAFQVFKGFRCLSRGQFERGFAYFARAGAFFFSVDSYWNFDHVTTVEQSRALRSHFNFYGGRGGLLRAPSALLFDPGYDVRDPRLAAQIQDLCSRGWTIGLHQSFNSWRDADRMRQEKLRLDTCLPVPVSSCRQHWLRFAWNDTWRAQQESGFLLDTTLGFNDRPGFRNGAALDFHPWDPIECQPMRLTALPMVLMDSHLYDYGDTTEVKLRDEMQYWIDEIRAVRGKASVIWHQHSLAPDYGWSGGFETFVSLLAGDRVR
jgi:hypothetical protein